MTRGAWLRPLAGLVAVLGASCGEPTQVPLDQVNFDRPVDIAFACYGNLQISADDPINGGKTIATAQPTASCETRTTRVTTEREGMPPVGQEAVTPPAWYAFILQSASGTVAVATWAVSQSSEAFSPVGISVLDTDPLTPGKNPISVGEDPVAIATDRSGCYEVTANAGSCDLSVLDISSALDGNIDTPVRVDRLSVVNKMGEAIRAKPVAMIGGPGETVIGKTCPVGGNGELEPSGVVYIAYPSCHVVAAVDMSSGRAGTVVGAIQFDAAGAATSLTGAALDGLTCPDECKGEPTVPGTRPVAIDLRADPGVGSAPVPTVRLAIGAESSEKLTMVELGDDALPVTAAPISQFALQKRSPTAKLGITALALSPTIGMGGTNGIDTGDTPGGRGQYVYAVATDNTVRVVDVLDIKSECDTQVDGRFVRDERSITKLQCFKVGDPGTPPRRSGARGPGIELTGGVLGEPVPTSVAFFKGRADKPPTSTAPAAGVLYGYFALITASSGQVFVVNVDDDNAQDTFQGNSPFSTAPVRVMAHQLRDSYTDRDAEAAVADRCTTNDLVGTTGGPRITTPPARNLPAGTLAAENTAEMPGLLQFACGITDTNPGVPVSELQLAAPSVGGDDGIAFDVRDRAYPDLRSVISETWTLTWEGQLSFDTAATSIDGKQIHEAQMIVDSTGMRMVDEARPFCDLGVEPFDIIQFRGCNPANLDADCPTGYTCYVHSDSKVSGIGSCMLASEAPRLANACRDFLTTIRRYTVGGQSKDVTNRAISLIPRKHELYATPLDGCTDDPPRDPAHPENILTSQCNQLAQYVAANNAAADRYIPFDPADPAKSHTEWSCRADPLRAPINADAALNKRCVQTCAFHLTGESNKTAPGYDGIDRDADCATGTICQGAVPATADNPGGTRGVCMEGVVPPPACVAGPQQFDVRASEAFTVIGSRSGYVHPIITTPGDPNGVCERDPAASPLQIGRLPLKAPACVAAADPITGALTGATPNPCSLPVTQVATENVYDPETLPPPGGARPLCHLAAVQTPITRQTTAIQLSNRAMTMHLVDPTYPGDLYCNHDRLRGFTDVAMIPPGPSPTSIGYQIQFVQNAGFTPTVLVGVAPVYPVKVVRGPTESMWVLDDGDFLSGSISAPSTRGQVFRIESVATGLVDQVR